MEEIGQDLANLYACIPSSQELMFYELLLQRYRDRVGPVEPDYLRGMLAVLAKHQLVAIETKNE